IPADQLGGALGIFSLAGRECHIGTGTGQRVGNHSPNAPRASRHKRHFAIDPKSVENAAAHIQILVDIANLEPSLPSDSEYPNAQTAERARRDLGPDRIPCSSGPFRTRSRDAPPAPIREALPDGLLVPIPFSSRNLLIIQG